MGTRNLEPGSAEYYQALRSRNKREKKKSGDHLTWDDRQTIERMLNKGIHKQVIADAVGCCLATIYNEMHRGEYEHMNADMTTEMRYSAEIAELKYCEHLGKTGPAPKILKDLKLREYIETTILKEERSPEAVLISKEYKEKGFPNPVLSPNTIYKGIDQGYFVKLQRSDLPEGGYHRMKRDASEKKKNKECSARKKEEKRTIEDRPKEIEEREVFGHWEGDCVLGKQSNKKCLLVLIERVTRVTIIEELAYHTADEVRKALNRIEKRMGKAFYRIFKTITLDNGSEFSDWDSMEKALYRKGKRTDIYFCHPNSPQERGSNECNNKMVRRRFPKGSDFDESVNCHSVKAAEQWVNNYPRKILSGMTASERFAEELAKQGIVLKTA
ncbi:MAG: IS30 family transposase [Emergencia sp.]|nr:IS30 family transposase [Emergencia sp.]